MARNLKPDYVRKLIKTEVPNGYKFDLANYLHNPSYDYDYPSFIRVVSEDEGSETIRRVKYFKHYDGRGEYIEEIYTRPKKEGWHIAKNMQGKVLESSNRFNIKKLISYCV